MTDIPYEQAVEALLRFVPEIRSDYDSERAKWHGNPPPAHVLYGSVFVYFLQEKLERFRRLGEKPDDAIIQRAFQLVEDLATSEDFETRCIVQASILESLLEDKGSYQVVSTRLGQRTKQMALKLMADWNDGPSLGRASR